MTKHLLLLAAAAMLASACKDTPKPAQEVLDQIDAHFGKRILMQAKLRSGARCRVGGDEGEFVAYCKDCQYCNGPYVVDLGTDSSTITQTSSITGTSSTAEPADWPMILGGSYEFKPIRCKGKLNEIDCWPFELGKEYVLEGILERHHPPRLIVDKFHEVEAAK